jgi:DNA-binding NtrC family response regulator
MTHVESTKARVLLVGSDAALLEGLAQSFAALGYATRVAATLHDARETAVESAPLLAVVERRLAAESSSEALGIQVVRGGAMVLYHSSTETRAAIPPVLQRGVMAELALPLERNRLIALAQHVQERVRTTGRGFRTTPPEGSTPRASG